MFHTLFPAFFPLLLLGERYIHCNVLRQTGCHPFVSDDLQKFEDTGSVDSLPFDLDACSNATCGTEPLEWFVIQGRSLLKSFSVESG